VSAVRLFSAEALLLDVVDLHDRDRLVTFLTRASGKKKGVARGARAKYSRFAGQLQPLAKVMVTWFEKEGLELGRIRAVELVRPAHRLQEDLEGILLGTYLADHLLEFAQEGEASDHLYRLLDSTLEALLAGADRDVAARYFEVWVLRLQGIFPVPRECPQCGREFGRRGAVLPPAGEALLCAECAGEAGPAAGALRAGADDLDFLRRSGRDALRSIPPPRPGVLRSVEAICAQVRRRFLHRELRSYDVIQRTCAGI
jgi:DNA repair protein RecO (recombination protein O)